MSSLFQIAKSGLVAYQKAAATVSHNIANANTEGYTRQRVNLSASVLRQDGVNLGRGVSVEQIQRLRNTITDQQIMTKLTDLGVLKEKNRIYQQLEAVLTTSSNSTLDKQLSNFFASFSDLANSPADMSVRNILLSKTQALTSVFHSTANNLENIARQTKNTAFSRVKEVNSILQNLEKLNSSIALAAANGRPDLNGKDQMVVQLKDLSKLVNSEFTYNENGTIEVRIGGITVLNSEGAAHITAETAPGKHVFRLRLDNGKLLKAGGGSLSADIHMIEEGIPALQQRLDEMAKTLVQEVNDIHRKGYGLKGSTGNVFFNSSNTTAETISINDALLKNPEKIAASSKSGVKGNGRIATQLNALKGEKILNGRTMVNGAIGLISESGRHILELETKIDTQQSAKQLLVNQQQSITGVNVDEELTNLIKYQNAYRASARVLSAARQMYNTLLAIV